MLPNDVGGKGSTTVFHATDEKGYRQLDTLMPYALSLLGP